MRLTNRPVERNPDLRVDVLRNVLENAVQAVQPLHRQQRLFQVFEQREEQLQQRQALFLHQQVEKLDLELDFDFDVHEAADQARENKVLWR